MLKKEKSFERKGLWLEVAKSSQKEGDLLSSYLQ
jgi:hypothetical protein